MVDEKLTARTAEDNALQIWPRSCWRGGAALRPARPGWERARDQQWGVGL